jgi:hypothetical protein
VSTDDIERDIQSSAAKWAFVQFIETVDKTDHTIKLRLYVAADCFVQVYANTQKQLTSYALVFNRSRIFGRDCEGGIWPRHPSHAPHLHDFSAEGIGHKLSFLGDCQIERAQNGRFIGLALENTQFSSMLGQIRDKRVGVASGASLFEEIKATIDHF